MIKVSPFFCSRDKTFSIHQSLENLEITFEKEKKSLKEKHRVNTIIFESKYLTHTFPTKDS